MSNRPGNAATNVPKINHRALPERSWADRAACAGQPTDAWFRDENDSRSYHEARLICDACPVRPDCLQWAIDSGTKHGLWGGLTPRERHHLHHTPSLADVRQRGHSAPDFLWTVLLILCIIFLLDRLGALR